MNIYFSAPLVFLSEGLFFFVSRDILFGGDFMKDIPVFVSVNEKCVPEALHGDKKEMKNMQSCRIPSLITSDGTVIAVCDKANCGADWGFIELAVRLSEDSGKSFGELHTIFTPPARIAPKSTDEYTSAFAIDPVTVRAQDGSIVLLFDFYPECKGLHKADLLVKSSGYRQINGEYQRKLVDNDGNEYFVYSDGFVYKSNGEKTNYYLPKNHSNEFSYQTVGDMYYTEGEPEFLEKCPPLIPDNTRDSFAGNIFLKRDSEYDIQKASKHPAKNSIYNCIESTPAPMTVPTTSFIWMTRSRDNGKTWSQPVDITPMIKTDNDEPFLGVGPGRGVCLESGRLLVPIYSVGSAFVIYSDDSGETWNRTGYCENLDECQFAVYSDGVIGCFGRPEKAGEMPYSVSFDGGLTWKKRENNLFIAKCQHSILSVPKSLYDINMDKNKDYIICTAPSSHGGTDDTRTDGKAFLGEINDDYSVNWIKIISLKTDDIYLISDDYYDFFAYSCMTVLPSGEIGLLYEAFPSGYIAFRSFSVSDYFVD